MDLKSTEKRGLSIWRGVGGLIFGGLIFGILRYIKIKEKGEMKFYPNKQFRYQNLKIFQPWLILLLIRVAVSYSS